MATPIVPNVEKVPCCNAPARLSFIGSWQKCPNCDRKIFVSTVPTKTTNAK